MTEEVVFIEDEAFVFVEGREEVLFIEQPNEVFTLNHGEAGPQGFGMPHGGTTGQIPKKNSNTDGDIGWEDAPESLPPGGTTDQILAKASDADGDAHWVDKPTSGVWGEITGTLSDQTDLATALASARAFAIAVS